MQLPLTPLEEAWNITEPQFATRVNPFHDKNKQQQLLKNTFNESQVVKPYDKNWHNSYGSFVIEQPQQLPSVMHVPIDKEPVIKTLMSYKDDERKNAVNQVLETHLKPNVTNVPTTNVPTSNVPTTNVPTTNVPTSNVPILPDDPITTNPIVTTTPPPVTRPPPIMEPIPPNVEFFKAESASTNDDDVWFFVFVLLVAIFLERFLFIFHNS